MVASGTASRPYITVNPYSEKAVPANVRGQSMPGFILYTSWSLLRIGMGSGIEIATALSVCTESAAMACRRTVSVSLTLPESIGMVSVARLVVSMGLRVVSTCTERDEFHFLLYLRI
jgi:hypothetical protein